MSPAKAPSPSAAGVDGGMQRPVQLTRRRQPGRAHRIGCGLARHAAERGKRDQQTCAAEEARPYATAPEPLGNRIASEPVLPCHEPRIPKPEGERDQHERGIAGDERHRPPVDHQVHGDHEQRRRAPVGKEVLLLQGPAHGGYEQPQRRGHEEQNGQHEVEADEEIEHGSGRRLGSGPGRHRSIPMRQRPVPTRPMKPGDHGAPCCDVLCVLYLCVLYRLQRIPLAGEADVEPAAGRLGDPEDVLKLVAVEVARHQGELRPFVLLRERLLDA